jgi:hypothetical protein
MKLKEVINRSAYGTIGYVESPRDVQVLERYILHNLPILREFTKIIVATNYGPESRAELAAFNSETWLRHFPECVVLDSERNRGHSIGTCDLDNLLFDHCKANGIEWLCKGANDVLLGAPVLEIEVQGADFYFLNAIAAGAMRRFDDDPERIGAELFYPQTNFYVIDVGKTDFLVDKELLDRSHAIVSAIPGYSGKIWEYIPNWSCENLLRKCVVRNRLTSCHLMDAEQFSRLLQVVRERGIEDCSHKNVEINGICHFHLPGGAGPEQGDTTTWFRDRLRISAGPQSSSWSPVPPSRAPGSRPTRGRRA